jgi:deoxyadenosine/deoxycytidine kinase
MYVVISGAHGIGKSTTAELVAKKLNGEYLTEALDEIVPPPQFGPKSKQKIEGQLWHIRQLLLKEKKIIDSNKFYIFDRGWADVYVYTKVLLNENQRDMLLSLIEAIPKRIPDLHIVVTANISQIKKRILERKRHNLYKWGENDLDYLKKINQEFVVFAKAFADLRPVYLVDISGTPEANADKIINIIKQHL